MTTRPNATVALIDLGNIDSNRAHGLDTPFRKLDGLSVLEWCVRRLEESATLDSIVITGHESLTPKIQLASLCSARWVPQSSSSSVERALNVANQFKAEWIVFVSPNCPFADPVLIDRLIASAWAAPTTDYVGFVASRRPDVSLARLGLVSEVCSSTALKKLSKMPIDEMLGKSAAEMVKLSNDTFQARLIPLPEILESEDLEFELQTAEDCMDAVALVEAVGEDLSYQRLVRIHETHNIGRSSGNRRESRVQA